MIRKKLGNNFLIVTHGVRPDNSQVDDQKRVATAAQAIKEGSNFLMVGRPILQAKDPKQAFRETLENLRRGYGAGH
jgi:orotidine-5'-phosphate decarboxylase